MKTSLDLKAVITTISQTEDDKTNKKYVDTIQYFMFLIGNSHITLGHLLNVHGSMYGTNVSTALRKDNLGEGINHLFIKHEIEKVVPIIRSTNIEEWYDKFLEISPFCSNNKEIASLIYAAHYKVLTSEFELR